MGLFFERAAPRAPLTDLLSNALQTPPPKNPNERAVDLASNFQPLIYELTEALASQPLATPAEADAAAGKKASAVTSHLLGGATFNTGRFLVATAIFLALVAGAVTTDAFGLKDSPTALYGLATTVFGIVVGFLGAEAPK
ncbi:MAG: hypothetical protein ABIP53_10090 [Candidatus Limnocylindrales bacterium]